MSKENTTEAVEEENNEQENNEQENEQQQEAVKKSEKKKSKKDKNAEKLAELQQALDKEKDSRLRLAAEYENYRKRTSAEKLSIYDDATAKAVEQILPIADSITMALKNMEDAPEEFKKGVELVDSQLKASFEKLRIEAFCDVNDDFDPNLHNAVAKTESEDFEANKISAVFQKGYKIGDKVIRHAMVQVANCD